MYRGNIEKQWITDWYASCYPGLHLINRIREWKKDRDNDLSTYKNGDNSMNGNRIVAVFRKTKRERKRFVENVLSFGRDDRSLSDKQKNRFINSETRRLTITFRYFVEKCIVLRTWTRIYYTCVGLRHTGYTQRICTAAFLSIFFFHLLFKVHLAHKS